MSDVYNWEDDEVIELTEEGMELVADWAQTLVDHNYDIRTPDKLWDAASFLIANGDSDLGIDGTRILLAMLVDVWDTICEF